MGFERFMALGYLRRKRRAGFISLITYISAAGVFLGTLVLVVALSVSNGFEKEVRDKIVGTLGHAKIRQFNSVPIFGYDSLIAKVKGVKGVLGATPYIMGKGGIEHDRVQEGVMIIGVDPKLEATVTDIPASIKEGVYSLDTVESIRGRRLPGIVIGSRLGDKMGVRQGSEVICIGIIDNPGEEPTPKLMRFTVNGIFETGFYEYDALMVYVSIASAQQLFNINGVEGIQIKTNDLFKAGEIVKRATEALGGYPFLSEDWLTQNRSLFQWIKLEKFVIFIVISLIVVVAAFNIVSSLIMIIIEKRREIGILMSMGSTSSSIMRIFLLNGTVIGFIGATAGTLLGVVLCIIQMHYHFFPLPNDIYFIDTLPVLINPMDVVLVYLSAIAICLLASSFPAWQASRILPAESIRYE